MSALIRMCGAMNMGSVGFEYEVWGIEYGALNMGCGSIEYGV